MLRSDRPSADVAREGMPGLGLGTWQNEDPGQCARSVRTALEAGYRHIDTAQAYGNETAVGDGLAAADVDREDVFLATKVWITNLAYDDVLATTERSLDRLGVDAVDLLYVHWPADTYAPEDTLPAFDELRDRGMVRHVGVSNFEPAHVERAMDVLDAPVFANQVETHPFLPQAELRAHADEHGYGIVGYSPLARAAVFESEILGDVATNHGASEAQVSLAWLREKGVTPIPKATSEPHIRDNYGSLDVELTDEEIERIDGIGTTKRQVDPDFGPDAWD